MQQEIDDLKKNCAMHSGGDLLSVLIYPLTMKRTTITSRDQELLKVRHSLMKISTIIGENIKSHLVEAWVMMS